MAKSLLKIFFTKYFTQNVRNKVYRWLNNSISKNMHKINANTCSYKLLLTNVHNTLIVVSINEDSLNKWININVFYKIKSYQCIKGNELLITF